MACRSSVLPALIAACADLPDAVDATVAADEDAASDGPDAVALAANAFPEPAASSAPDEAPPRADAGDPRCPQDMVLVDVSFCPDMERRCLDLEHDPHNNLDICHAFARDQRCRGPERRVSFCIDRYEYPDREGAHPTWMLDWYEAQATCGSRGKRLCWASEWTAACEGPDATPFPYGRKRDHGACNMDNFFIEPARPSPHAQFFFYSKDTDVAFKELSRLDQSVPSGSMASCRSGFGVYDLTGNVDEWVVSDEPPREKSRWAGLKGGAWGHVRSQCRPMTYSHEPDFKYYFVGFRCCRDVAGAPRWSAAPGAVPAPAVEPHDFAPDPVSPIGAPGPSRTKFTWVRKVN
jgi:formylglycine-generating enzyme